MFHELCDNKGPTLTLFHVEDGNKVGIYTPLSWDNASEWKNDMETFIFNLNKNKKYKKLQKDYSIYCNKLNGIYSAYFGNASQCKTMKKIKYSNIINKYYENGSDILPSNKKETFYDLFEDITFTFIVIICKPRPTNIIIIYKSNF